MDDKRNNIGYAGDGKKPRIVSDLYKSTKATGQSVNIPKRVVPHVAEQRPNNQYGRSRILTGKGKGK